MAAMLSAKRAFVGAGASAPSRRTTVRVSCSKQGSGIAQKMQVAAAAVAMAALLHAGPVSAKVIIEQPQLKKLFQEDVPAAAAPVKKELTRLPGSSFFKKAAEAGQSAPAAPKPKAVEASSSGGLDPNAIALPLAVVAIAGGAAALNALDDEFGEFMDKTSAKNSLVDGAGYEVALKNGAAKPAKKAAPAKTGTKKVKAAASKSGTTSSSPLSSFFGKE